MGQPLVARAGVSSGGARGGGESLGIHGGGDYTAPRTRGALIRPCLRPVPAGSW